MSFALVFVCSRCFAKKVPATKQYLLSIPLPRTSYHSLGFLGAMVCSSLIWLIYRNQYCQLFGCDWGKLRNLDYSQRVYISQSLCNSHNYCNLSKQAKLQLWLYVRKSCILSLPCFPTTLMTSIVNVVNVDARLKVKMTTTRKTWSPESESGIAREERVSYNL